MNPTWDSLESTNVTLTLCARERLLAFAFAKSVFLLGVGFVDAARATDSEEIVF